MSQKLTLLHLKVVGKEGPKEKEKVKVKEVSLEEPEKVLRGNRRANSGHLGLVQRAEIARTFIVRLNSVGEQPRLSPPTNLVKRRKNDKLWLG